MDMKYKYQPPSQQGRSENYERMDRRVKWLTIVATLMTLVAVASLAMSVYVGYEMVFGTIRFSNCSDSNKSLHQEHQQEMQKMREQLKLLTQMVTTLQEASVSRVQSPPQRGTSDAGDILLQGAPSNADVPRVGLPVGKVTEQQQQMDEVSSSTVAPVDHHHHQHHHAESSNSHQHHHTESSPPHQHHSESSIPHQHHHTESSIPHQHHHTESSVQHQHHHQHHQTHHQHHQHHHGGAVPIDESSGDGMGDDEDTLEDFEFGSGEVDCPKFPKPYCPVGRRVCLTKERCPRPVCC